MTSLELCMTWKGFTNDVVPDANSPPRLVNHFRAGGELRTSYQAQSPSPPSPVTQGERAVPIIISQEQEIQDQDSIVEAILEFDAPSSCQHGRRFIQSKADTCLNPKT